ncbi:hypothetical protein [Aerococcus sanguinicola]|nr:hypothetical protein [Aerococcus sanguinicola]
METREERNALIQEHFGFIIKTVSEITGRYVEVGNDVSLDDLQELGFDPVDERPVSQTDMKVEIEAWKEDLEDFAITLEQLADEAPKHRDTRERAIDISEASSKKRAITDHLFTKKRLPIRKMSRTFDVTEKVIKGSKTFIISVIIIFVKEYRAILDWIRG